MTTVHIIFGLTMLYLWLINTHRAASVLAHIFGKLTIVKVATTTRLVQQKINSRLQLKVYSNKKLHHIRANYEAC